MLEEERKFDADSGVVVPDLTGCLPPGGRLEVQPPKTLTATYHDTDDLRLARAGASLRYRRGDRAPWTVKLPTSVPGRRTEVSLPGDPGAVPADLVALVTCYSRGAGLSPRVVLRTRRQVTHLYGADGRLLAEVDDDQVAVLDGARVLRRFREIEVERHAGRRALLDKIGTELRRAGATSGTFTPKHVRALGVVEPPDLVPPAATLGHRARAGEVVAWALRADIARVFLYDPLVRLRDPLPDGDTPVHQMRVGARRLSSDLRTFRALLDPVRAAPLRAELRWLGGILGAVRDAEVLRARLRRTAGADPVAPLDDAAVARVDAELAARYEEARAELERELRTARYHGLLDRLVAVAASPGLVPERARRRAADLLPRLAAKPWRQLAHGSDGLSGPGELDPLAPDEKWHEVRIRAKRARYAVEAVVPVVGRPARDLGRALAAVQDLLGEHQDAAVAAQTWLAVAHADPDDHALAVTAGRLVERERAVVRRCRAAMPAAWAAATQHSVTVWLP